MDAAQLFELLERWRKSRPAPISEAWTSAAAVILLDWLEREHQQTPPRLHREEFARLGCMSPEQARGRPLDVRSDLFSAAAVLFELCCGRLPFDGIDALVDGALLAPRALNEKLSEEFAAVLSRALAFDPARRFATAAELRAALVGVAPPVSAEALDAWVVAAPPAPLPSATAAPPAAPAAKASPRRALGMALVFAVPVAATFVGLRIHEQHQIDAQQEYANTLRPCEIISEPAGAALAIDGAPWKDRAPTMINLEPDRDYVIELRAATGSVVRKIRNQKRLSVRLYDGAMLVNVLYGTAPPDRRAKPTEPEPTATPVATPAPKPDHIAAYDLETAPASFTLWPEHQVIIPRENCVAVATSTAHQKRRQSLTPADEWLTVAGRAEAAYGLPLFAMYESKGMRLAPVREWIDRDEPTTLCTFMLSERSNERSFDRTLNHAAKGELAVLARRPVYVAGDNRLLVRSVPPGRWRVRVQEDVTHLAPVMMYERRDSAKREAVVLSTSVTVQDPKWLSFTVPVRGERNPDLKFSVEIEKER